MTKGLQAVAAPPGTCFQFEAPIPGGHNSSSRNPVSSCRLHRHLHSLTCAQILTQPTYVHIKILNTEIAKIWAGEMAHLLCNLDDLSSILGTYIKMEGKKFPKMSSYFHMGVMVCINVHKHIECIRYYK